MRTLAPLLLALSLVASGCKPGQAGAGNKLPNSLKYGPVEAARTELKNNPGLAKMQEATGNTALHLSTYYGQLEVTQLLLDNKADVNARNALGQTPVHRAAAATTTNPAVMELLLKSGGDVNARDATGRIPLILAIMAGNLETVKVLIEHKSDLTATNDAGFNPLMVAVGAEHVELPRLLVDARVDLTARDPYGNTPLHHAAGSGTIDTVKMLIAAGADPKAVNRSGETPYQYVQGFKGVARAPRHNVIEKYLKDLPEAGASKDDAEKK